MSTRSSIWLGESKGKYFHIYWELADRDIELGQKVGRMAAPVYIAVDEGDADREVLVRLPKAIAEQLLNALAPSWHEGFWVI